MTVLFTEEEREWLNREDFNWSLDPDCPESLAGPIKAKLALLYEKEDAGSRNSRSVTEDGSAGSGNWGHSGRPGKRGGSATGGGAQFRQGEKGSYTSAAKERVKAKAEAGKPIVTGGGGKAMEIHKRYATKEEYQAAKKKAKSEFDDKAARIEQDFEQECDAINAKYGSKMRQRIAIRRDESLTDTEKQQKLDELDRKFEKRTEELEAVSSKRDKAYRNADEECNRVFDPDYEYKKISGTHSATDDVKAHVVNPEGLHMNCQRCAVAYEMRRRGYDVCASSGEKDSLAYGGAIERCFIGADTRQFSDLSSDILTSQARQTMLDWGEGSRAVVCIQRREGFGHAYNMFVSNGEVFVADSQIGVSWSDKSSLEAGGKVNLNMDNAIHVELIRTDNAALGLDVEQFVREAGE